MLQLELSFEACQQKMPPFQVGLKYNESVVIRITGCPNGCARPYMAELGLVGDGPNSYQVNRTNHIIVLQLLERIEIISAKQVLLLHLWYRFGLVEIQTKLL